ncbi:Choline transporter-like protein 2 [Lamellibrachia satsuma]|nr:Choline transporter-like protein 2 [Lamellibrachia satsuma]
MKDNPANQGNVEFTTNLDNYTNLANTWLAFSIICGTILLITLILLIFLRKRILIAIAVIKSASRAVGAMIFTLFWPLIPFLLQVILFVFWGASAIYLASSGSATYSQTTSTITNDSSGVKQTFESVVAQVPCSPGNDTAGSMCNFLKYGGDQYTAYLQFFQLFMLFWVMNFIVALGQVTLAGAFASYYWAFNKPEDVPAFPVSSSLWRALRYHLGSIAFGSLIIAIIQIIRVILEYIDHKLNKYDNAVVKFLLKCLKCCFWCLEKFMKFLNKNAYILIAVYGKNFCTSAKNAFFLILRNIVRVVVIDKVTGFLLLIGKLVVVGIVGVLAFIFFSGDAEGIISVSSITDYMNNYKPELNFYLVPVIIIIIGTYVIASGFFSVYSMGVDTVFLCFLEDLERNDGSAEKPYYMSKDLMELLGKKNQVDDKK